MTDSSVSDPSDYNDDLTAAKVAWDLEPLLGGAESASVLMSQADAIADELDSLRGRIGSLASDEFVELMTKLAEVSTLVSRAGHYAMLRFSENTLDPERGAAMQVATEESTAIGTKLIFFDLEWANAEAEYAEAMMADERLGFCRHHLENLRRNRPYLLSEPEEAILAEKSVSGSAAWSRFYDEQQASLAVQLDDGEGGTVEMPFEAGLSMLGDPDRSKRKMAAQAVTDALEPGLRTSAFVFNTLLLDKATDDRLRSFPSWLSSQNLANEATDESVQALIEAVVSRYDIPRRWYSVKAEALGLERLSDYDRMASVASSTRKVGWAEASEIVQGAYASFSPEIAAITQQFFDEDWIDAPTRPGKRTGAFCAYTVPEHHPYVFLNWTGETRDVSTLAHELGHAVHGQLAREQGVFHQSTPLTLAETASVFGETVTNNRLLSTLEDPGERFALLASTMDDMVATVFRQVAMNQFEDRIHTARRSEGELTSERFADLWIETQTEMMGDSVELSENYRSWWSYVSHFVAVPGYVYAYAYGMLFALSVYAKYEERGKDFVPAYVNMLRTGGSVSPADLGAMVDCDLTEPGFWLAGLDIADRQLRAAEEAARQAGRIA